MLAPAAIANAETVICLSNGTMPQNRLIPGTTARVIVNGTYTGTNATQGIFRLRFGTAGTTADGQLASFTLAAPATTGTAVPFNIVIDITIRTSGATGTAYATLTLVNQGTTGISTTGTQVVVGSMSTLSTLLNKAILSLTYISGHINNTATFQTAAITFIA